MGIDYSSAMGYGFIVDQEKIAALYPELYEEDGMYEVMEAFTAQYPLLSFDTGHDYGAPDSETDFAVLVESSSQSHGYRDGSFGVFMLDEPSISAEEYHQLALAYKAVGGGRMFGPLAIFRCS